MQIDFHHATTYVLARLAGFDHPEANIVAHSAQYVDDATNDGTILFDNGAMYKRISSAHKEFDYRHFDELGNHQVWIPFHFLPGNDGLPAGQNPDKDFIHKIICRPNSYVAKDMLRACINEKDRTYGLHRLGITMHVYADTWAHQGFAGVNHRINSISNLEDVDSPSSDTRSKLKTFFGDLFDGKKSKLVGNTLPLGHGAALSFPDRPYLKWSYIDGEGKPVSRDNTDIFMDACDGLYAAMQRYRASSFDADVPGLSNSEKNKLKHMFTSIVEESGEKRHEAWLNKIAEGYFEFPAVELKYVAKGKSSWKYEALGTDKFKGEDEDDQFRYEQTFLASNWKLFHDALQAHRFDVIHNILPKYGICAA